MVYETPNTMGQEAQIHTQTTTEKPKRKRRIAPKLYRILVIPALVVAVMLPMSLMARPQNKDTLIIGFMLCMGIYIAYQLILETLAYLLVPPADTVADTTTQTSREQIPAIPRKRLRKRDLQQTPDGATLPIIDDITR